MQPDLVKATEAARQLGINRATITKYKNRGLIRTHHVDGKDLVSLEEIRAAQNKTDFTKVRTELPLAQPTALPLNDSGATDWQLAKARQANAAAEKAELDLRERRGELVSKREVESAQFQAGRLVRDRVMGVPRSVSQQLAQTSNVMDCELIVQRALAKALTVLSDDMSEPTDDAESEVSD